MEDFRTDSQKHEDKQLVGTWWRCQDHELTDSPILLGHVAYCPSDGCAHQVKLVHSAINDPNVNAQARSVWRKSSDLFLAPAKEADMPPSGVAKKSKKKKTGAKK